MTEVVIWDLTSAQYLDLVHNLVTDGLKKQEDFEFVFVPSSINFEEREIDQRSAHFFFKDAAVASWFKLKHS